MKLLIPHTPLIVLMLSSLSLNGCSALDTQAQAWQQRVGSVFGGKASQLQKLVDAGNLPAAQQLFEQHQSAIQQSTAGQAASLKLAKALSTHYEPRFQQAIQSLQAQSARDWTANRHPVKAAEQLLAIYQQLPVIRATAFTSPTQQALTQQLQQSQQALKTEVPKQFMAFIRQNPETNFFEQYPVTLTDAERTALIQQQLPEINRHLSQIEAASGAAWLNLYRPWLPTASRIELVNTWLERHGQQQGWTRPYRSSQRLQALSRLQAQVPAKQQGWLNIAWIGQDAATQSALTRWQAPSGSSVVQLASLQREQLLSTLKSQGFAFAVIVQAGNLQGQSTELKREQRPAKYLLRHDMIPNPELPELRANLQQKMRDLRDGQIQHAQTQSQLAGNSSALGALAMGMANWGIGDLEKQVSDAQIALSTAPMMLSRPVYAEYPQHWIQWQHQVELPLQLLVIDVAGGHFHRAIHRLRRQEQQSVPEPSSIHPQDVAPPALVANPDAYWRVLGQQLTADWAAQFEPPALEQLLAASQSLTVEQIGQLP